MHSVDSIFSLASGLGVFMFTASILFIILIIVPFLLMLPLVIAMIRGHGHKLLVAILALMGLASFGLLWLIALIWSVFGESIEKRQVVRSSTSRKKATSVIILTWLFCIAIIYILFEKSTFVEKKVREMVHKNEESRTKENDAEDSFDYQEIVTHDQDLTNA